MAMVEALVVAQAATPAMEMLAGTAAVLQGLMAPAQPSVTTSLASLLEALRELLAAYTPGTLGSDYVHCCDTTACQAHMKWRLRTGLQCCSWHTKATATCLVMLEAVR